MELFTVIDRSNSIFLSIQEEVCVEDFNESTGGRVVIWGGSRWEPSKSVITFAEKYFLFREKRVIPYICLCCWRYLGTRASDLLCGPAVRR
jgi:hypothetical protein